MPHPARALFCATLALAAPITARAQNAPSKTEASVLPESKKSISPRTLSALKAATPKFDPALALLPSPTGATSGAATPAEHDPSIVRMPDYVVNEGKLPNATEVMTRKALAEMAMNRYLGSKDGLDRGFLNRFTLPQLFQMIPVIGRYLPTIGVTNEDRALQRYYEDDRKRKMNDFLDLGTITSKTGNPELGEQIKRETKKTFMK